MLNVFLEYVQSYHKMAIPIFVPLEKSNLPKNPIKYKNMYLPTYQLSLITYNLSLTHLSLCVCVCVCSNVMEGNGQHIFLCAAI